MTFHRAINYGAVLQAFALCKFINNMGVECEVIDYRSIPLEETYKIFDFKRNNLIAGVLKGLIKGHIIAKKKKKFNVFLSSCISLSKNQYEKEEYKKRLNGYKNISLREENAVDILRKIGIASDMDVNIDPTFLLSSDIYSNIAIKPSEEKYILVFSVNMPVNLLEYAKKLAALKNLKVIYINDKPIMRVKGIEYKTAVSPEEFLGYIKNAEYVATNSFHGTAFSVIFHKQFFVEYHTKNGRNSRAEELLNKLNITGREIISEEPLKDTSIDWESVDNVIGNERVKSINYLKKIIKG